MSFLTEIDPHTKNDGYSEREGGSYNSTVCSTVISVVVPVLSYSIRLSNNKVSEARKEEPI